MNFIKKRCNFRTPEGYLCRYYVEGDEELCYFHEAGLTDDFSEPSYLSDISSASSSRIDAFALGYRHGNKNMMEDIHFKIKVKGRAEDIELFHSLVGWVDSDYPENPFRLVNDDRMICNTCNGFLWRKCMLSEKDLNAAAKQCGVIIKIKKFLPKYRCTPGVLRKEVVAAEA